MNPNLVALGQAGDPLFGPFADIEELIFFLVAIVFLAVGLGLLYVTVTNIRRAVRIIRSDPIPAGEVESASGAVELQGTVEELDGTINGKYSNAPAVATTWREERKKTTRDKDGNQKTNWETVETGDRATSFSVADETGAAAVDPSEASLSLNMSQMGRGGRRRQHEGKLQPGDTVHVLGEKETADDPADAPGDESTYVGAGDGELLISDTTEGRTALRYAGKSLSYLVGTVIALAFGIVITVVMLNDVFGIQLYSALWVQ